MQIEMEWIFDKLLIKSFLPTFTLRIGKKENSVAMISTAGAFERV